MYGNNIVSQSGAQGGSARADGEGASTSDRRESALPAPKFGDFLGIYTKSLVAPPKRVHDFILQDQSCKLLPKHRVCNCLKKRIDKHKNRSVKYNVDRKKSHWSNVQRCASLWVCPVCAKPITEGRRTELSIGLERWKKEF